MGRSKGIDFQPSQAGQGLGGAGGQCATALLGRVPG